MGTFGPMGPPLYILNQEGIWTWSVLFSKLKKKNLSVFSPEKPSIRKNGEILLKSKIIIIFQWGKENLGWPEVGFRFWPFSVRPVLQMGQELCKFNQFVIHSGWNICWQTGSWIISEVSNSKSLRQTEH